MKDVGYEVEMMDGPNGPEPRICTLTDGRKVPLERADRSLGHPVYDYATGRIREYGGAYPPGWGPFEPKCWATDGFPYAWSILEPQKRLRCQRSVTSAQPERCSACAMPATHRVGLNGAPSVPFCAACSPLARDRRANEIVARDGATAGPSFAIALDVCVPLGQPDGPDGRADQAAAGRAPAPSSTPRCCPFHATGGHSADRHGFDTAQKVYGTEDVAGFLELNGDPEVPHRPETLPKQALNPQPGASAPVSEPDALCLELGRAGLETRRADVAFRREDTPANKQRFVAAYERETRAGAALRAFIDTHPETLAAAEAEARA